MALVGDSVRLLVQFKTCEGVSIEPQAITLTIYDNAQVEVITIPEDELVREGIGKYYYDFIVPDELIEYFIFEYAGLHNNKPILSRGKVNISFTK